MNSLKKRKFQFNWNTRQMTSKQDREMEIETTLRELIIYVMFVVLLAMINFGIFNINYYLMTKSIRDLFIHTPFESGDGEITFKEANKISDFWTFLENVVLDAIYWESWYGPTSSGTNIANIPEDERMFFFQSKMIGIPILRQLRVRDDSCDNHESIALTLKECWAQYTMSAEDTKPFGPNEEWKYTSHSSYTSIPGIVTSYPKGGYITRLAKTYQDSKDIIDHLKDNLWIDRATRAVFLEFTVYNINVNLFCVARIIAEFPATGGMYPSWSFETVKLIRYVSTLDHFILGCECGIVLFIIFYSLEEIREIVFFKWYYFIQVWNYVDIFILVISYYCYYLFVIRYLVVAISLKNMFVNPTADFNFLSHLQGTYDDASSFCLFLAIIKVFKYISFTNTLSQLQLTLRRCAMDLLAFSLMFLIVFEAYAVMGHFIFGPILHDYFTYGRSHISLLRIILGDFEYDSLRMTAPIFGPIFFITFVFFVFFILMNMFLAIINDTFTKVKEDVKQNKDNDVQVTTFLKRIRYNMPCVKTDPIYIKLSEILLSNGFTINEIEQFFAKYGIVVNHPIGEDNTQRLIDGYKKYHPTIELTEEDIKNLERVKFLETSVSNLDSKLDMILRRLDVKLHREDQNRSQSSGQ